MAMRFYKINGQYQSWDYLHDDLGYTQEPSTTTSYKSSASDTWGQSIVDSGYNIATDSTDLETYQFWIDNVSGWYSASEMAQEGYYPSFATDGPRFVKEGELSVSVEISGNSWSGTWYLLKKDVAIGWCTERELEENGWEPDRGEIVGGLISDTYDKRIYSFGNGGLLVPGGYAYQDGDLLDMQWDFGGVVEEYVPISQPAIGGVMTATTDSKFYGDIFGVLELDALPTVTSLNGIVGTLSQSGTQASVADGDYVYLWIYSGSDYVLATIGSGNTVAVGRIGNNPTQAGIGWDAERTSDGYVKIINNSGSTYTNLYSCLAYYCDMENIQIVTVYKISDGVAFNAFKCNFQGSDYYYVLDWNLSPKDWTDDLSSIGYIFALELDVGLRWRWSGDPSTGTWRSIDLSTDDWYYAGLLSQADADRLTAFGLEVKNVDNRSGVIGNIGFNPYYSYKVIALYSDIVNGQGTGEITFNPSNFYAYNCNYYPNYGYWDALLLEYSGASGTAKGWRVRIEKINPTPTRHTAYTQTDKSARSVAANSVGVDVYDENGSRIPLDSSLIYSVIAYYESSSGDPVQPNGQILLQTFFSSYISISNNITQRTIQRVEYIATPKQPQ